MKNKMKSVGFVSPEGKSLVGSGRYNLYNDEKKLIKAEFSGMDSVDWFDSGIQKKLKSFARQVIQTTTDSVNQSDLISSVLPTETVAPGDTFVLHEISGANIYYGTYGASVRMSRPQFTKYTGTALPKEVGLKLELTQIQAGKYSPSELGEYTAGLITAWKNRLLFVTTLGGNSAYQSGGAQYKTGNLSTATLLASIDTLTDEAEMAVIIGRRNAIHQLSIADTNWSNDTKREFESKGQIGTYAGIPVLKVNSFTDNDYGVIYPMPKDDLWIFSELPAGRYIQSSAVRTADETIAANETLNLYFRWNDGISIWHTDRIARIGSVT